MGGCRRALSQPGWEGAKPQGGGPTLRRTFPFPRRLHLGLLLGAQLCQLERGPLRGPEGPSRDAAPGQRGHMVASPSRRVSSLCLAAGPSAARRQGRIVLVLRLGPRPPLCNQSSSRLLWMEINAVPKPPVSWAAVPPLPYTLSPSCNPRGTETRSTAGGAAGSPPRAWPSPASGAVPWSLGGPRPLPPASPPPGQGHSRTQRVLSHLPEPGPPLLCLEVLPPLGVGRRGPRLQPLSILVPCPPTPPHPRGFHAPPEALVT